MEPGVVVVPVLPSPRDRLRRSLEPPDSVLMLLIRHLFYITSSTTWWEILPGSRLLPCHSPWPSLCLSTTQRSGKRVAVATFFLINKWGDDTAWWSRWFSLPRMQSCRTDCIQVGVNRCLFLNFGVSPYGATDVTAGRKILFSKLRSNNVLRAKWSAENDNSLSTPVVIFKMNICVSLWLYSALADGNHWKILTPEAHLCW